QVPLVVFVASLGFVPSNQLFITVGLTKMRLAPVAAGFFAGRAISYTVSAQVTAKAAGSLDGLLRNYWNSPSAWVIQLVSIVVLVGFTMIPWRKVLHISAPTAAGQTQSKGSASSV
ncbi:MAG TPA: hypothetical protein VF898_03365, partial [Chloroflexota bacterium]